MKSSAKAIGTNIKKIRTQRSMTQDALAESLYVTRQTVSNYEIGKTNPDIDTLLRIAEILDTDINALIYGQPEPESRKAANRELIISVIVFGVLLIVTPIGLRFLKQLAVSTFRVEPMHIFQLLVVPVLMLSGGWLLISLLDRFVGLKPLQTNFRKTLKIILYSLLILNAAVILPFLVWNVHVLLASLHTNAVTSYFPTTSVPGYSFLFRIFYMLAFRLPYLYILPGIALRIIWKPQSGKEKNPI